jgi:hypothetical protein
LFSTFPVIGRRKTKNFSQITLNSITWWNKMQKWIGIESCHPKADQLWHCWLNDCLDSRNLAGKCESQQGTSSEQSPRHWAKEEDNHGKQQYFGLLICLQHFQ